MTAPTAVGRFRPVRFGIVGLYEYADQEFTVEDGRLALRGRNTSGKSKALELLVPFVLDGDITPRKLDPFASSAKTMRWNLIECTDAYGDEQRANKRIGYVWGEFARDAAAEDEDGEVEYLTCGIGLEASRHTDGVRGRWYFTTPQRVGDGLCLTRAKVHGGREPVTRGALDEQLQAGGGALHDGPTAYKEALRAQLLPFATPALYEQTLDVIRLLRKPKLSDNLNVSGLSKMLAGALPPVDDALVRRLGDALEQLHELQRQHDELREARAEVASIAEREYRSYARGVVAVRADRLRAADSGHERARTAARATTDGLDATRAATAEHDAEAVRLDREHTRADGEYLALVQSEAYKVIAVLDDRGREHEAAAKRAQRSAEAVGRADGARTRAAAALEAAATRLAGAAGEVDRLAGVLTGLLGDLGLDAVAADRAALAALPGRLAVRRQDVEHAGELAAAVAQAAMRRQAVAEPLARAGVRRDELAATAAEMVAQVQQAVEAQLEALSAWRAALGELVVTDADLDALADAVVDGHPDAGTLVAALAEGRARELAAGRARTDAERERCSVATDEARARAVAIEAERDPHPDPRAVRPPDREGRPGTPLWAAVDFADGTDETQRADLEAALQDAGILDAWISPDGHVHDSDLTLLAPGNDDGAAVGGPSDNEAPEDGASGAQASDALGGGGNSGVPTLAALLVPDPAADAVEPALVARVLAAVPLDGLISVAPGRFRFGPLHGQATKPQAEFIGAAARARRRERLLAEARAQLREHEDALSALDARLEQLAAATAQLDSDRAALPSVDALRAAQRGERQTAERLDVAEAELTRLVAERDTADRAHTEAADALTAHGRAVALAVDAASIAQAGETLGRAETAAERTELALDAVDAATAERAGARAGAAAAQDAWREAEVDHAHATADLDEADGRLRAAQAADGATAEQLQERAAALRAERETLDTGRRRAEQDRRAAADAAKDAEREAERAEEAVHAAEAERVGALGAVRVLGRHDLISAAVGREHAPEDERSAAEWSLTVALERIRALPDLDQRGVDLGNRARKVGEAVSQLQRKLSAFDMNAATYSADEITLVEITREGRPTTPTAMLTQLDADLEHREQILSAKRREVLGRALLGEIAEHLRSRITAVRASVRERNATLRGCPTGAGRTVSLSWDVDEDAGAPAPVLGLLGDRATEHLADADRETLFAFLHQRIADARAGAADEAAQTAIVDHLAVALDYRRWWRFTLHLHERDGSSRKLTARTQGLGSGGEQSVLMHLPLFATAAQLYDLAPGAPRIIALDEAMDGIDPPTREQMFALLVALDLDWVMTSYDINPCVATVPRVGFYELHRDNAEWGVWAQHFVWDGEQVTELVAG